MKNLILSLTLLFISSSAFAADCAKEVINESEYTRSEDVKMLGNTGVKFSADRVQAWNDYFEYKIEQECIEIMDVDVYQGQSGKIYVELTTNDDPCDGGNTFGIILDLNNQIVGEIGDSDYYCPNN